MADAEQLIARHATATQDIQVSVPRRRGTQASFAPAFQHFAEYFHVCTWR